MLDLDLQEIYNITNHAGNLQRVNIIPGQILEYCLAELVNLQIYSSPHNEKNWP